MLRFTSFLVFFFLHSLAFAGVEFLSEKEFRDLASRLAPKVNLFDEVWRQDPAAMFYGGTTRDYLYWLKGRFLAAKNRAEALALVQELRREPAIDVRDFIIGDSDVDVVSKKQPDLDPKQFGVRKLDSITPDIFNPKTVRGNIAVLIIFSCRMSPKCG